MVAVDEAQREVNELLGYLEPDETLDDCMARLSRLCTSLRTSLPFLEEQEAKKGIRLRVGQVLELAGPSGACKTESLLQAAATCVLPQRFDGCGSAVLFVDMSGGLDPLRLVQILDARIRMSAAGRSESGSKILRECLARFQVVRCFDNLELVCALKASVLRQAQQKHRPGDDDQDGSGTSFRLILVDNISAFYWSDRNFNGAPKADPLHLDGKAKRGGRFLALDDCSYSLQTVRVPAACDVVAQHSILERRSDPALACLLSHVCVCVCSCVPACGLGLRPDRKSPVRCGDQDEGGCDRHQTFAGVCFLGSSMEGGPGVHARQKETCRRAAKVMAEHRDPSRGLEKGSAQRGWRVHRIVGDTRGRIHAELPRHGARTAAGMIGKPRLLIGASKQGRGTQPVRQSCQVVAQMNGCRCTLEGVTFV